METDDMMCERAFLADDASPGEPAEVPVTYESLSPISAFRVVAFWLSALPMAIASALLLIG